MRFMSGLERSRHKASWGEGEVNKRTFISSVSGKCILFEQEIHCRKSAVELLHFSRLSTPEVSILDISERPEDIGGYCKRDEIDIAF